MIQRKLNQNLIVAFDSDGNLCDGKFYSSEYKFNIELFIGSVHLCLNNKDISWMTDGHIYYRDMEFFVNSQDDDVFCAARTNGLFENSKYFCGMCVNRENYYKNKLINHFNINTNIYYDYAVLFCQNGISLYCYSKNKPEADVFTIDLNNSKLMRMFSEDKSGIRKDIIRNFVNWCENISDEIGFYYFDNYFKPIRKRLLNSKQEEFYNVNLFSTPENPKVYNYPVYKIRWLYWSLDFHLIPASDPMPEGLT